MKPYYEESGTKIYNCDWRELSDDVLKSDLLLTDPPYGLKEAAGKNASRNKAFGSKTSLSKNRVIQAKDYGVSDWDNNPPSEEDLLCLRGLTKWQIIFGGNYFFLPPSRCWLVWDKVNSGDFADCELAWTNLDKAVRKFTYMWNGMLKENPEYRSHPTQKPRALFSWCLTQSPDDIKSVVDPYAGVCTTAVCCKAVGISCICVDREEKYCEDGANRLRQEVFQWEEV